MAIFGPNQNGPKYAHVGYPEREHKKTNLPVKKSIDLDVWLKSFDPNKIFEFYPYVTLQCKT